MMEDVRVNMQGGVV